MTKSVINRNVPLGIKRKSPPKNFREDSEILAAYEQVGFNPERNSKSWYRDIYEFYQNNEC